MLLGWVKKSLLQLLFQADFNGCWDPHIKDKRRDIGEAWFRPHGNKECCKWSVCRAKGEVVNGCTKEACGFIPQSCKDETCSYKRFLNEVDDEADNDEVIFRAFAAANII